VIAAPDDQRGRTAGTAVQNGNNVTDPSVWAQGLSHQYRSQSGSVQALSDVDVSIAPGEFVALLGPSGSGKSTLLRCLSGLLSPSVGMVRLAGQDPISARTTFGLGWLAQADGLLPWRTVAENVALPLRLGGRDGWDGSKIAAIVDQVGLADSADRYPHELSGGMRQRAALARALVAQPAFLFLDEPFANLVELIRERLGDLLLEIRAATRPTTLLVTHSVTEAVRLADRILVFSPSPGRIVLEHPLSLPHPRQYDQPSFGASVETLKRALRSGPAVDTFAHVGT
jgi:NitT/TauT family transport system ATP-binding protein